MMCKTDVQLSMHYITNSARDEDYKNGGSLQQGTDGGTSDILTGYKCMDAINKTFTFIPSSDATVIGEVNRTFTEINGYFLNTILFTCRAFVNLLLFCYFKCSNHLLRSISVHNTNIKHPLLQLMKRTAYAQHHNKSTSLLNNKNGFSQSHSNQKIHLRLLTAVRVCPSTHVHTFSTYTSHNTEVLQL